MVAFRIFLPIFAKTLLSQLGKVPLSLANSSLILWPVSFINFITFSAVSVPSFELYFIFMSANISAKPITPNPILRLERVTLSISSIGYLLTSITSSRKRTDVLTTFSKRSKSTSPSLTKLARFIEPRLHDSYGNNGCSPHGFVLSISPISGVGLSSFMRSMKIIPGSPFL